VAHRVRAGETLTAIAHRYHTSVAALVKENRLLNASYIRIGQILRVPVRPAQVRTAAADRLPASVRALMSRRSAVRDLIVAEARRAGVPAALALAVAWQESGWQQRVTSSAGAVGVMQLLPSTARWVAESMLGRAVDVHDTRQNVRAGVTLLKHYLLRYRGDLRRVLAAYYQGQRSVDVHGVLPVSRPYIASILALEELIAP
jgi:soluble lytic murein transglycosylase-like protein